MLCTIHGHASLASQESVFLSDLYPLAGARGSIGIPRVGPIARRRPSDLPCGLADTSNAHDARMPLFPEMLRTGSTPMSRGCVKTVAGWSKKLLISKTLSSFAVVARMVASNLDEG